MVPIFYHYIVKRQHDICELLREATGSDTIVSTLEKLYRDVWVEKVTSNM